MSKCNSPNLLSKKCPDSHDSLMKNRKLSNSNQFHSINEGNDANELLVSGTRNIAHVFCARIQKETEEFLYHLENQTRSFQRLTPIEVTQKHCGEDDEETIKLKYLVMIHTTCSQITNMLVNSQ